MIHAMGLLTIGGLLLGSNILGSFIATVFKDAAKGVAKEHLLKAIGRVAERFKEGKLPKNHDIEGAFREALGGASVALALHLHDPDDRQWHELLGAVADWPRLAARLGRGLQGNIVAGDARSHWLASLVEASKDSGKLQDFPLGKLMEGADLGDWLATEVDLNLAAEVEGEYLAWVARNCPDNGARPAEFARLVREGWPAARRDQGALTFYQVFALFLISRIKASEAVFRATTLAFHQELKKGLEELKQGQLTPGEKERLLSLLERFDPAQFEALFNDFRTAVEAKLNEILAKLDRLQATADDTLAEVRGGRRESREGYAELSRQIAELTQKIVSAPPADPTRLLTVEERFAAAIEEVAKVKGWTVEEVQQAMDDYARSVRENPHAKAMDRALADFVERKFTSAAAEAVGAAQGFEEQLLRAQAEAGESRRRARKAYELAGDAEEAALNHGSALAHYQKALEHTPRAGSPEEWAALQLKLGGCHWDLGIRVEGGGIHSHLQAAVAAYGSALEVYARESLPQAWATTQNNLGNALGDLAGRQEGGEGMGSLRAAVAAYGAALEVQTRASLPQDWAMTQNNLGVALRDLAGRQEGEEALGSLRAAVAAYRAALEVRTRESLPQAWATTQNNLGIALSVLAGRQEGAEAMGSLRAAVAAYRAALEVYTRETLPQDWAGTQNNLGTALWSLAGRQEGAEAMGSLRAAVAAYRAALEVRTRESLPQDWAMTQNNLGAALSDLAGRQEGEARRQLLLQSVAAYEGALEIFTRVHYPHYHAMASMNLESTRKLLGGSPPGE